MMMMMDLWSLFQVATMPILQVLIIALLGAFLATSYVNVLTPEALSHMNKVVFAVFTPSLLFISLAKAITLQNIISWWFMPVNLVLTSIVGGILGWIMVKVLRPTRHLGGLVIASCCAGNWGNILLIIVPAICGQKDNPFGEPTRCSTQGLTYASLSAALGSYIVWTYGYSLMKNAGILYEEIRNNDELTKTLLPQSSMDSKEGHSDQENQITLPLLSSGKLNDKSMNVYEKSKRMLQQIVHELLTPPNAAATVGFIVGVIPWLKSLIIGATAPLRVIQDSITLLADGTIPSLILILGGNLTKGLRKSTMKSSVLVAILFAKYVVLPLVGICVVQAADKLGFLPEDKLYKYVLLLHFSVPPAMNIGTMAQLFNVGQEECSVIFLWTYLAAAPMMTIWSTIYMWILS